MDQTQITRQIMARRAGRVLLCGLHDMATQLPSPHGKTLRVTVEIIESGEQIGTVDVDATNADDLGALGARRAIQLGSKPAPTHKPQLRLVGGGQ
jgi:hypothetical protein